MKCGHCLNLTVHRILLASLYSSPEFCFFLTKILKIFLLVLKIAKLIKATEFNWEQTGREKHRKVTPVLTRSIMCAFYSWDWYRYITRIISLLVLLYYFQFMYDGLPNHICN